jgi:transcriptional regulator with XRE-family HTH domain
MAASERPRDRGAEDARRAASAAGIELRSTRQGLGLSLHATANAAGISPSHLSRLERGQVRDPTLGLLSRVGRVLGLATSLRFFPAGSPVRDAGQMQVLARFVRLVAPPLVMPREVPLPIQGDLRAWDGMLVGGQRIGFVEGEVHLGDTQALARRIALKQRDDPRGEVVILVVTRSAHNRRVLAEHREALRAQFPLDGAAIARALRTGLVPSASGIIML